MPTPTKQQNLDVIARMTDSDNKIPKYIRDAIVWHFFSPLLNDDGSARVIPKAERMCMLADLERDIRMRTPASLDRKIVDIVDKHFNGD